MIESDTFVYIKIIDILFRRISPEKVLHSIVNAYGMSTSDFLQDISLRTFCTKETFFDYADTTLYGYSGDEQGLLYDMLGQRAHHWTAKESLVPPDFMIPVIDFANSVLTWKGLYPVCKNDAVLVWRDAVLKLGQDFFVCAFLAYHDLKTGISRNDFTWPVNLHVDNPELYQVLHEGVAENHNHLKGGTQSFPITWIRLMNQPEAIRTELKHFDEHESNLFPIISRHNGEKTLNREEMVELAALIRTILLRSLLKNSFNKDQSGDNGEKGQENENASFFLFREEYIKPFSFKTTLSDSIDRLRFLNGAKILTPDEDDFCPDYALSRSLLRGCTDSDVRIMIGERYFLYRCFQSSIQPYGFSLFEKKLLYLYLIIQIKFRSEMIQNNGQTGFKNFQNYQDRKDDAWDNNSYFWEASRIAINHRIKTENIESMECRIVPSDLADKNIDKVRRFDSVRQWMEYADDVESFLEDNFNTEMENNPDLYRNLPWFYVFHFVKAPDACPHQQNDFWQTDCRNSSQRKIAEAHALGIMEALSTSPYLRSRLRGIDAASDEFHCRPEVFAKSYRFLSKEQYKWNANTDGFLSKLPVAIRKTYHVGEDFPDIADGLRAIDEAIEFLELEPGSRLGHCLALGVEPEDHYHVKHSEIITTKQDRLDDLVWILFRSWDLGVPVPRNLEAKLKREAWILFKDIYGQAITDNNWHVSLEDYRCSMHLRGDDPSLYITKKYKENWTIKAIDNYRTGKCDREYELYRSSDEIAGMYYYYHYGTWERIKGNETCIVRISQDYKELMRKMQEAMMGYVSTCHLTIECNISSNVLIGTFKKYEKHPVFRFNDRKLNPGQATSHIQLPVCINTDDLGVFDTSLDFEYALLYAAIKEMKTPDLKQRYNDRNIMEYMEDLRVMGLRAVFPGIRQ